MTIRLLRLAVVAVVAALAGQPARAADPGGSGRQTFQYYDYRIDIDVPRGWKVLPRKGHFDDIRLSAAAKGGGQIDIAFYQPLNSRNFDDFRAFARRHLKTAGLKKVRFRNINGSQAFTGTGESGGQKFMETEIGFKGPQGGEVFVVFLSHFDERASPSTPADYEAIVRSLKISPSPPPPVEEVIRAR